MSDEDFERAHQTFQRTAHSLVAVKRGHVCLRLQDVESAVGNAILAEEDLCASARLGHVVDRVVRRLSVLKHCSIVSQRHLLDAITTAFDAKDTLGGLVERAERLQGFNLDGVDGDPQLDATARRRGEQPFVLVSSDRLGPILPVVWVRDAVRELRVPEVVC